MDTAVDWDAHYATEAGARWWPNEELVRWLSGRGWQFLHAIDVGAGTGGNIQLLTRFAHSVTAVEPNVSARANLAQRPMTGRAFGNFTVVDADARSLPTEANSADLVVDCMTSQHIPWAEHQDVYAEYWRVLKPGGWLWLYHLDARTTHNPASLIKGTRFDFREVPLFPSLDFFCLPYRNALTHSVRSAGFEVDEVRGLGREYPDTSIAHYTIVAAQKPPRITDEPTGGLS